MNTLMYFLYTTTSILLIYNFLTALFFCFKKDKYALHKYIHTTQQLLLVALFFTLLLYLCKTTTIPTEMFLVCWILGFLTSHLFITRKKRWMHELLGLGILLAITIVLFFKQEEIIQTITQQELGAIRIEITSVYLALGLFLGAIFWPKALSKELL